MGKYRHNTNGSTELVLVKQNFLLRGIRDSRTLIVQYLIGAMHGLVVSILVIRNFALTEFALARLHCTTTDSAQYVDQIRPLYESKTKKVQLKQEKDMRYLNLKSTVSLI